MLRLVPIVEGDGEINAVPLLIRRLLHEFHQRFDVDIAFPKNAHGRENLLRTGGIERFVRYALKEADIAGVVLLLDAEHDVPCRLACALRARVAALNPSVPVVIVCAEVQYESWFVESIETLRGKCGIAQTAARPELHPPNPKTWLEQEMPSNRAYKETTDQVTLTAALDFDRLSRRSRSFRRLHHAVEELLDAFDRGTSPVTPLRCEPE